MRADRRVVLLGFCSIPVLLTAQASVPPAAAPRIPLCSGLSLVTAVNDSGGDYESIKTLEAVNDQQITLHYSTQRMDYGDMFNTDPPKLRSFEFQRIVQRTDIQSSRAYLQEFSPFIPEAVPGMTAFGTSTAVLNELKGKGEAEFGISHWAFVGPMTLDPNDSNSIYRKQMATKSKVVDRGTMTVLVNGQPMPLPFVHTTGDFYSYISEFWFLDQPDNPVTLKFRIGVNEIGPLSASDKDKCKQALKLQGYQPQHCLRPDGGDKADLELVKINYRCGAATLPPAASGAAAAGTGIAAGDLNAAGGAELETALAKDNRVEIFDIFFSFDSDEIRKESEPRLKDIAAVMKRHPDWRLKVEGHTDSLAADDYNLKLSQRRAAAVKNALVSRYAIEAARLSPEGFGETRPRASNDTLAGRARNRRVELVRIP